MLQKLKQNLDTNDIQPRDLELTIDEQLYFEILLMEARGKIISYATYKKSNRREIGTLNWLSK